VVDAFDAMTTGRAYRPPMTPAAALDELQREAGIQFDGELVRVFLRTFSDLKLLPISTPIAVGALHEAAVAALTR